MARKSVPHNRKPWYSNGIRFECAGTGNCCTAHGEYNRIYISDADAGKISALLGIELGELERLQHCLADEDERQLDMSSGACPFLKERRCSIYEARPTQCRSWPFWKDNFKQKIWTEEIETFCEGVGRGPLFSQDEIEALWDERQE